MAKDFAAMEDSNRSTNFDIHRISDPRRRVFIQGGLGAAVAAVFAPLIGAGAQLSTGAPRIGFKPIPPGTGDTLVVPQGYSAEVIAPWGEPVGIAGSMPQWRDDASNTAADQAVQMGMHHDGIHFYTLAGSSTHGLLAMNHEYTDDGLLHADGVTPWTAEKVRKSQAAHGIAVIEVRLENGRWSMVRPSRYARRFTAYTPFAISGAAAGHPMMRTAADPAGRTALGTLSNCASGMTPWGTYLSGEENFAFYFDGGAAISPHHARWGIREKTRILWSRHDERFDVAKTPNEPNRFGWVVEIDPMDPSSTPVKRTSLGRAAHEGAWVGVTRDNRAVVYSGEDAAFEYIYKFVSRDAIAQGGGKANRDLLDHGTLYVARFAADGSGRWIPLVHGRGPLTAANGFADQGEVVIKARQASDALGATKMDRPEWLAIDQRNRVVYCALTNNVARGSTGSPDVDPVNPRANNTMGGVIRWQEDSDFDATAFRWSHLVLAGDPANSRAEAKGDIKGDIFACPDGLMLDARGILWIQTDAGTRETNSEYANIGNNQMLACDPATGEIRRFLTGPTHCEITGATLTPDARTMFVNIQHPGQPPDARSDPANPRRYSSWPSGTRPRSATVVIRRRDGGVIGT